MSEVKDNPSAPEVLSDPATICEGRKQLRTLTSVPGGIRTPNLLIRSQKLYPVELQAL
jgi:hypothetical protein